MAFAYTFHNAANARAASDTASFTASAWEIPKTRRRGTIGCIRFLEAQSA
jgi:hypothetical protein